MKNVFFLAMMMIGFSSHAQQALGEVYGYLVEKQSGESVPFAHVFISDFSGKYEVLSDDNGMFRISAIPAGTYTINIRFEGDTIRVHPVNIGMNTITQMGQLKLEASGTQLGGVDITPGVRLIMGDLPVPSINAAEIAKHVNKNDPKALITSLSSEVRLTEDGELVFRGARKGDMLYIVDGIKGNSVYNIPSSAINSMMVYTGALPAKYGDTMGGVVIVESKSYFDLYRDWKAGR